MKIANIQLDIAFGDPTKNYQRTEELIKTAMKDKPDIVVLPELWTTGYDLTRLGEIGDQNSNTTLQFFKRLAQQYNVAFVGGSIPNKNTEGIYNTLLIVDNCGNVVHQYSKLHLFKLMDEHKFLKPGNSHGLFKLKGETFAGFICYDIRFPEWIRTHTDKGAKALFMVAEWPIDRLFHWRTLLISRAIENQAFVIACNRVGSDPNNKFAGHSMIIDPWGDVIAEASAAEEILIGEIDLHKVTEVRKQIPIFEDRRPEYYFNKNLFD